MIQKSSATIVPVFFQGHNSRLFQVASHLHYTLRVDELVRVTVAERMGTK